MINWLNSKFVEPLCHYYTLESTLVYGLLLVLVALGTYKFLMKHDIKIDKKFFYAILPFIIYGGWTRALRDHFFGIYQQWWWCSPPIYILIFAITIISLFVSLYLEKKFKKPYWKFMIVIASILLVYNLSITHITNWLGVSIIGVLIFGWSLSLLVTQKIWPEKISLENTLILIAHLFDASATYTALTFFNYYEQHVLPGFLINILGPWIMFPLKIIVVYFALYVIDKNIESLYMRNFLKLVILILGLAQGTRDFLTIAML